MKDVRVTFEDKEHAALVAAKGKLSWRDFILQSIEK
jgi:hypothetical protein